MKTVPFSYASNWQLYHSTKKVLLHADSEYHVAPTTFKPAKHYSMEKKLCLMKGPQNKKTSPEGMPFL